MAKTKKQALGRGLSALLRDPGNDINSISDENAKSIVGNIVEIDINSIRVNPNQPRLNFDNETLVELASSIKELGIIQPITVRKTNYNEFELIAGERRLRASKLAKLKKIPAYVRIVDDTVSLEMALVENIQRRDLDAIEIALTYQRLIKEIKITQDELSKRVGKNRSTITNYIRLLKLDPIIQTGIRDGFLSMGHARAIINVDDSTLQLTLYKKIISDNISVRETETLVKNLKSKSIPHKKEKTVVPNYIATSIQSLQKHYPKNIVVKMSGEHSGSLVLSFKNKQEFEAYIISLQPDEK